MSSLSSLKLLTANVDRSAPSGLCLLAGCDLISCGSAALSKIVCVDKQTGLGVCDFGAFIFFNRDFLFTAGQL